MKVSLVYELRSNLILVSIDIDMIKCNKIKHAIIIMESTPTDDCTQKKKVNPA